MIFSLILYINIWWIINLRPCEIVEDLPPLSERLESDWYLSLDCGLYLRLRISSTPLLQHTTNITTDTTYTILYSQVSSKRGVE